MVYQLTWLAGVLRSAGLKVAEVPGWESRGRADMGQVFGILCHHTATPLTGNMPTLKTLVEGRPGLAGPLAQLGLGRDGTYYVIAAGRANHAGEGVWQGKSGNSVFIGIEAENAGTPADPWPGIQLEAYRHGVAAILRHLGLPVLRCAGHKEYAPQRKIDPSFDMEAFRAEVSKILEGGAAPLELIPAMAPGATAGDPERPTLRRGATGPHVRYLQAKLVIEADGYFGPQTEAAVRQFQRDHALVPDGIVGPKSWVIVDTL